MLKFTKIIAPALIAALAMGAAVPAQARHAHGRNGQGIEREIAQLERDVNRNDNRDRISEREAAGLRSDVAQLRYTYRAYARNGLSSGEVRTLQERIRHIRHRLQNERHDVDHRRH